LFLLIPFSNYPGDAASTPLASFDYLYASVYFQLWWTCSGKYSEENV